MGRGSVGTNQSVSVAARVRRSVAHRRPGVPFTVKDLLGIGSRAAIDQALHRLTAEGVVERVARGVYARPKVNPTLGRKVPVSPEKVVEAVAKSTGEKVSVSGAEAARRFRLSTQMPLSPVYLTTGSTRTIRVGQRNVRMRHVAPARMALAGTVAGEALTALLYLGRSEVTPEIVGKVRAQMGESEYQRLLRSRNIMPGWLSDSVLAAA